MIKRAKDRFRHTRGGLVVSVVGVMMLAGALVALASHPSSSGFLIDGTVEDPGAVGFADDSGNTKELGPINSNTTKLGVINTDALPTLGTSNPNGQVDLVNVWFDTKTSANPDFPADPTAPENIDWLYFAWERDSTHGSGVIAIELQQQAAPAACDYTADPADLIANCNPWANRSAGDLLLIWDQVGNDIEISVRTFDGTSWGAPDVLNEHEADAALNEDTSRGEAVIDLATIFPTGSDACLSIANVIPGTITGNSDNADYKDTVLAPIADVLSISNCGSVVVKKVTDPASDPEDFGFTSVIDLGDGNTDNPSFSLDTDSSDATLNDEITISNVLSGNGYSVTETVPVSGWDLSGVTCTVPDGSGGTQTASGFSLTGSTASFDVNSDETVTCTFTNVKRGSVKIVKVADPEDDQDFEFETTNPDTDTPIDDGTGDDLTDFLLDDDGEVTILSDNKTFTGLKPGSYTVDESAVTGWDLTGLTCVDTDTGGTASTGSTTTGVASIELDPGETVTCTYTNSSLHKVIMLVCHTGTGELVASSWDEGDTVTGGAITSIDATGLAAWASTYGVSATDLEAAVCALSGFTDLSHDTHEYVVTIPGHPS